MPPGSRCRLRATGLCALAALAACAAPVNPYEKAPPPALFARDADPNPFDFRDPPDAFRPIAVWSPPPGLREETVLNRIASLKEAGFRALLLHPPPAPEVPISDVLAAASPWIPGSRPVDPLNPAAISACLAATLDAPAQRHPEPFAAAVDDRLPRVRVAPPGFATRFRRDGGTLVAEVDATQAGEFRIEAVLRRQAWGCGWISARSGTSRRSTSTACGSRTCRGARTSPIGPPICRRNHKIITASFGQWEIATEDAECTEGNQVRCSRCLRWPFNAVNLSQIPNRMTRWEGHPAPTGRGEDATSTISQETAADA